MRFESQALDDGKQDRTRSPFVVHDRVNGWRVSKIICRREFVFAKSLANQTDFMKKIEVNRVLIGSDGKRECNQRKNDCSGQPELVGLFTLLCL